MIEAQYIVLGLAAGVVAGLFGVGGGLVIVPFLLTFAGFKIHSAVGTSLGALLLPVGILGVWEYYKSGHVDVKIALLVAGGLVIGTYFGAKITQPMAPIILKRIYAVFLIIVAARLLLHK